MRAMLALAIMVSASGAAAYSDFEVVSVVPRSPHVKPFVMSIPAKEQRNAPRRDK